MKVAYCPKCKDLFKLIFDVRSCRCGESSGVLMQDKMSVQINGPTKVIGIEDRSFFEAVNKQPKSGSGKDFKAFVLPIENKSVRAIIPNPAPAQAVPASTPIIEDLISVDIEVKKEDNELKGE
jgi:hypothetical protein